MIGGVTVGEIIWTCGLPHLSGVPHLPAIFVTLSWDTPCCTHISDKKLCSSPPPPPLVLIVFASDMKTGKNHWGGGGGGQKITLLSQIMWRGDEYCSPRPIKLGHPVLYPNSDKKVCSLPSPPCCFFASHMQQQQKHQQKLYFHDHKGIIVLQKLLV